MRPCAGHSVASHLTDTETDSALDASIDEAAEILREYYSIQEIGDPGAQSQVRGRFSLSASFPPPSTD